MSCVCLHGYMYMYNIHVCIRYMYAYYHEVRYYVLHTHVCRDVGVMRKIRNGSLHTSKITNLPELCRMGTLSHSKTTDMLSGHTGVGKCN